MIFSSRIVWGTLIGIVIVSPAMGADVSFTMEACANASSIFSESEVCYVVDMSKGEKQVVVKICGGLNWDGKVAGFGAGAKALICSTVAFDIDEVEGLDDDQIKRLAEEEFEEGLDQRKVKNKAAQALEVDEVDEFSDVKFKIPRAAIKEDIWELIDDLDTSPFAD